MATPVLPPYMGTWDHLVNELLHNPFLGGGRGPTPHIEAAMLTEGSAVAGPSPDPWSPITALLSAITVRDAAARVPGGEGVVREQNAAINAFLDDFCGTGPHSVFKWPWPGPPPWVYPAVSELTAIAHTFEAGSLREGVIEVAGQMMERALNTSRAAIPG